MQRQLRFGIIYDGGAMARWQIRCVKTLLELGGVNLALVIVEPTEKDLRSRVNSSHLLFQLYRKLLLRPPALKTEATTELFSDIPKLSCQTVLNERLSEYFRDEDVDTVRGYDLDFILGFGRKALRGKVLNAAQYGIWSFEHGDVNRYRESLAGFWAIYRGEPVTGAALQRLTEEADTGVVLRKGYFRTQASSFSKNLQLVCSESSRWPAQVCSDILNDNAGYLTRPPVEPEGHVFPLPTNRETILFLAKILTNRLKAFYRLFFRYSFWNIGVVEAPIEQFLDPNYQPRIEWLPRPPKGEFKADPFGMLVSPNIHVFFENLDYHRPKGIIYTTQLANGNLATEPRKMIELPVHMSYPYIVEYGGEVYCVPETNRAREICVYKSVAFPYEWQRERALLTNVMAIDTTIFQHDGTWWMMFTDRQRGGDANLYVWYAPDFWGPWKPHLNNPVKSDVRSARPGGTPFYHEGFLYRPAQDCSRTGGGRIVINRITTLSPSQFDEEPAATLEPDRQGPYPEGLHTLSQVGRFTLVDGKKFEFSAFGLLNNIVKGIRRTLDQE